MTYADPANPGVAIDGTAGTFTPIAYTTGAAVPVSWQMVTGAQGSVVTVRQLDTDITGLNVDRLPGPEPGLAGPSARATPRPGARTARTSPHRSTTSR
jgi:hypothetical protein